MECDKSVTVTRDIPVTSHVPSTRDNARRSRVSHATTTTPHHTIHVVEAVCGVSGSGRIHRCRSVSAPVRTGWMH
jgi:hypothetical protein